MKQESFLKAFKATFLASSYQNQSIPRWWARLYLKAPKMALKPSFLKYTPFFHLAPVQGVFITSWKVII